MSLFTLNVYVFPWLFMSGKDPENERGQITNENCSSELIVSFLTLRYHFQDNKIMFPFRFPERHGISTQTWFHSLPTWVPCSMMRQDFRGIATSEFKLSKQTHSTWLIIKGVTINQGLLKGSSYRLWPLIPFLPRVSDVFDSLLVCWPFIYLIFFLKFSSLLEFRSMLSLHPCWEAGRRKNMVAG